MMDSNSEYKESHDINCGILNYSQGGKTNEAGYDMNEEFNKKRCPVSRCGNNPGRIKRVVSCKRRSHHLLACRMPVRRPSIASTKDSKLMCDGQRKAFVSVPCEVPDDKNGTGETDFDKDDCFIFDELARDHGSMQGVLFERHLRLKVSSMFWQRNIGELLAYLESIQDIAVFANLLPVIIKSIDARSDRVSIGFCVDLFPLVKKVLSHPYEEYLLIGLKWINSVLKNWSEELKSRDFGGSTKHPVDVNFAAFNQLLLEFWHENRLLADLPGPVGDLAVVIDLFVRELT